MGGKKSWPFIKVSFPGSSFRAQQVEGMTENGEKSNKISLDFAGHDFEGGWQHSFFCAAVDGVSEN